MISLNKFIEGCLCHTKEELFKTIKKQEDRDILAKAAEIAFSQITELSDQMKIKLPVVKEFLQGKIDNISEFITWNQFPHRITNDELDYINTCVDYHRLIRDIIKDFNSLNNHSH